MIAGCAGTWELLVTRLSSVFFFIGVTQLVIGISLLGFSLGAVSAKRLPPCVGVLQLAGLTLILMPLGWGALSTWSEAWLFGVFAFPFVTFGMASTLTWRAMESPAERSRLYFGEAIGTVTGLLVLGPLLLSVLPVASTSGIGINSHLFELITREGLVQHDQKTNSYATTDIIRTKREDTVYFFTDARFVTRSVAWDGQTDAFESAHIENLARMKRLAMAAAPADEILLLGAGAGFDIAVALQAGAGHIDAVEVNAEIINSARLLDAWSGGVINHPDVSLHIAEARRFVSQQEKAWDQINLALMQTSPATGRGSSHVDGRVLTREAIEIYLAKLRPKGIVTIIQNTPALADRTTATALSVAASPEQLLRFALPDKDTVDNAFNQLLILRNEPFSDVERGEINTVAAELNISPQPVDVAGTIVTDDQPFMFESFLSSTIHSLTVAALSLTLFAVSLLRTSRPEFRMRLAFSAALVGAIMLAVQALIMYRAQAALGNPVTALSVALSASLLGAGTGAFTAEFMKYPLSWKRAGIMALIGCTLLATTSTAVTQFAITLSVLAAAIVVWIYVFLCTLPLGIPFLAVMTEGKLLPGDNESLILASDGIGGVIGAALGGAVAMLYGFNALAVFILVLVLIFSLQHKSPV